VRHSLTSLQSEAFAGDLTPYVEEARTMYPGGRFQRFLRSFDRIFHRGVVEMIDMHNAMVLADRAYRAALDREQSIALGRQALPSETGWQTMREMVLGDLYDRIDAGEQVAPGLLAQYEGHVQEERTQSDRA
jgi:hypothetical protein